MRLFRFKFLTNELHYITHELHIHFILSQVDFEAAAQSVITETLREVKRLRPKALWGVSPYPSCYNGDLAQTTLANYTSQCPPTEMALNDELLWLWKRSSALYPLLTLEKLQVGNRGFHGQINILHLVLLTHTALCGCVQLRLQLNCVKLFLPLTGRDQWSQTLFIQCDKGSTARVLSDRGGI